MNPSRSKIGAFNLICSVYLSTLSVTYCWHSDDLLGENEFEGMSNILISNAEFSLLRVKMTTQHHLESSLRVSGVVPPFSHSPPERYPLLSRQKSSYSHLKQICVS